jgi:DNA-binding NtrC family response regulator
MRQVLAIDDNPAVTNALRVLCSLHEIEVRPAASPAEGLEILRREPIELVITDMNFTADTTSGSEGVALFREIRARYPDLPVILLTAWTNLETAVQLIKAGAADYIGKPWDNNKLMQTIENLLELSESTRERARAGRQRRRHREHLAKHFELRSVVFESEQMGRAVELACRVARSSAPVLITGPNGTGKERLAEIVHANSAVRTGPLVAINCGALPPELLEAELFGVESGAYTGAQRTRPGRFELADGGTLFLDEIGDLPLPGQVKLLRVVETGQYQPLGSGETRSTRARIISATNADLPAMIAAGRFRQDLYYRLNLIEIPLPALAERPDDIIPLAEHFLGPGTQLSEDARAALLQHTWPGNVRELRNSMDRAKLLTRDGWIRAEDLNLGQRASGPLPRAHPNMEEDLTREMIEASLSDARGNITRAAQSLGISRQALYRRMERFGLRS